MVELLNGCWLDCYWFYKIKTPFGHAERDRLKEDKENEEVEEFIGETNKTPRSPYSLCPPLTVSRQSFPNER